MTDNNPDARKPLILIAEDVESNYKLLEIILKKEYELLWAKNGKEAVDYALERHPDAVLMDIKMPVMDGIEALKEIKAMEDANILIIKGKYKVQLDEDVKYISSNCSVDDDGIVTTDDSDENLSYIVY